MPRPPAPDDILTEVLARLRTYAPPSRVEIALKVAQFHAGTSPQLAGAWRAIEMAQVIDATLTRRAARLVASGTADALKAEVAAQYAHAAEHIALSGIEHADDAWPPRPN